MTETMPSSTELSVSLLRILTEHPNGLSVREIDQAVIRDLQISEVLAKQIRTGNRTEFQYRMAWCRTKAKKAGLIERTGPSSWKKS